MKGRDETVETELERTTAAQRPYPRRAEALPWRVEAVTAEWLTRTLDNRYPGIVVETMTANQFIDSHTSKLRVSIKTNQVGKDAGLPANLCLKSNWSGDFADVDICELEARFYHHLRDHMTTPIPKCYYADWDGGRSGQGLIILEDLVERGGTFGNSLQHSGVDGVAKALEGLAQLHAGLWNSPLLDRHEWLPASMETPVDNDQIRIMWRWIEKNLENPAMRAVLPQALLDDPDRLQRGYDALIAFENAQTTPRCIILGDCHQGNTYIMPGGERMWLDWQLVRKGRPWRDVTYFTIGALTIEERRRSERDLLAHYRQALAATGVEGVIGLDEIWDQYRRWVIYGMQAWIANMDHWGQIGLPMNERFFTAGEDLDTWTLLGL
jgi:hypothetical protein